MNPTSVVNAWITSLIRIAIAGIGGWFVRKGVVSGDLWEATAALLVAGGITAFWALYEKYNVKAYVLTALRLPSGSSQQTLEQEVKVNPATS